VPRTFTSVFSEPEDFQAELGADGVRRFLITGRGQFRARLTRIVLDRMCLTAGEEVLSRTALVAVPADMVLVTLPIAGSLPPFSGGIAIGPEEMITLGPGQQLYMRIEGPCRWGTIQLPSQDLLQYGRALNGAAFVVPLGAARWRSRLGAVRQVRHLHQAAIRRAEARSGAFVDAEAAHGLEQQLIHTLMECLSTGKVHEETRAAARHQDILARFEDLLEAGCVPRMADICAAVSVSERLLRQCCKQHLGIGPSRYINLRRMQQVRRILRNENPSTASVSEVAKRYGFRDPGRFATNYRALYGELPSATLRRHLRGIAGRALARTM
jgi:AraC-like DNA-binding protein